MPPPPPPEKEAPPTAVLSVAEQIAARIAAKNASSSSSSSSSSAAASSCSSSSSSSGTGEGRKRKFSEAVDKHNDQQRRAEGGRTSALVKEGSDVERKVDAQEEQLVTSEWGRAYRPQDLPSSSSVSNMLPESELAKYTTLLPGRGGKDQKKEEEARETIKIESSNIGHKLLSKMGWKKGKGVGAKEDGKVAPVATEKGVSDKSGHLTGDMGGVGAQHTWDLRGDEDVYEQFRKRNMLGYRYRPNPFDNPRKLYY
uniref:G-patch domain-containing protein n=1 Tax=Hemiselmis andersenii TaxID=464988 RepID=A0A7S0XR37_HEMAN